MAAHGLGLGSSQQTHEAGRQADEEGSAPDIKELVKAHSYSCECKTLGMQIACKPGAVKATCRLMRSTHEDFQGLLEVFLSHQPAL